MVELATPSAMALISSLLKSSAWANRPRETWEFGVEVREALLSLECFVSRVDGDDTV